MGNGYVLSQRPLPRMNPSDPAVSWLDPLPDGIAVLGRSLHVLYCNAAFADLFGRAVVEVRGSLLPESVDDPDELPFRRLAQQVLEQKKSSEAETTLRGRCWQVRCHPVPEGVLFLLSDVTARRQLEEELIQTAWHSRLLLEQLPTIHWTVNTQLRFTLSIGAALARLGLASNQVVGMTLFEFFKSDDPDHYPIRMHRQALEGQTVRFAFEYSSRFFDVVLEPFRDATGKIVGIIGLAHDVTDRRQAEEERLQLRQQFYQAQKLESLGLLAGGIAHDFGNLLVSIQNATELLLRELPAGSHQRSLADMIRQAGQRASEVTRQMLVCTGKRAVDRRCLDLNQLIQENLPLLRSAFPCRVQVATTLDPQLPTIHADPGQIQQVVMNLIINASEAIGRSQGTIQVTTRSEELPDGFSRDVVLEVSDTGCGMSPEVQARIFDPFYTTKSAGRGLGLAAVQGILESHQGRIEVRSVHGQGTTFFVYLPLGSSPPAAPAAPSGASEPDRVLYVEDEQYLRDIVGRSLSAAGIPMLLASSGEEALELFRRHQASIKLIILDLVMPGMDGWETLKALHQIQPDLKVVLASGHLDETSARRPSVQVVGVLPKPYHLATLIDLVTQHCRPDPRRQ